jgi:hypothetical protein
MRVTIPNPVAAVAPPPPPRRSDGGLYRYELIALTEGLRTYADRLDELVGALIDGYEELKPAERKAARRQLAEGLRSKLQASLLAAVGSARCSAEQLQLLHSRGPIKLARWTGPAPSGWRRAASARCSIRSLPPVWWCSRSALPLRDDAALAACRIAS